MTFLFCIVEIVLHATRILNPVVVLVFACLKALGWLVMVILNIITTAQGAAFPWLNFILSIVLLAAAIVQVSRAMLASPPHTHRLPGSSEPKEMIIKLILALSSSSSAPSTLTTPA